MEDIAYLVTETYEDTDDEGNIIRQRNASHVLCKIQSVTRREFYQAATQDITPEIEMIISHRIDYNGEKYVIYNDILYDVTRAYWENDKVSLTLSRSIGSFEKREGVLIMPDGSTVIFNDGKRLTINY